MGDWRDDKEAQEAEFEMNMQGHNSHHAYLPQGDHPQKQTIMKQGVIKSFNNVKPYQKGQYTTYYANIELENGDKINTGLNKEPVQGMSFNYNIKEFGQHEYQKAEVDWKSIVIPSSNGAGPQPQRSATSPGVDINDSILYQVCLKEVSAQMVAHGTTMPSENDLVEFAFKLAVASKKAIEGMKTA